MFLIMGCTLNPCAISRAYQLLHGTFAQYLVGSMTEMAIHMLLGPDWDNCLINHKRVRFRRHQLARMSIDGPLIKMITSIVTGSLAIVLLIILTEMGMLLNRSREVFKPKELRLTTLLWYTSGFLEWERRIEQGMSSSQRNRKLTVRPQKTAIEKLQAPNTKLPCAELSSGYTRLTW